MADTVSTAYMYQEDFEKVCRSGYVNATTGRCGIGLKSKNKVNLFYIDMFLGESMYI